jgi:hypothetical protein
MVVVHCGGGFNKNEGGSLFWEDMMAVAGGQLQWRSMVTVVDSNSGQRQGWSMAGGGG